MKTAAANALHRQLLTLDTHLDTPVHFARPGWNFGERHHPATDIAQLDLPRMAGGNLSGGFFVIFTAQDPLTPEGYAAALVKALRRSQEIDETIARHSDRIGLATSAADARRLHDEGRLIAFKSMENGYPLGEDLGRLAIFRSQGVRLAGPVHTRANQLADSATDGSRWNGLSPLGQRWVAEMNRLGIVIDASHASDAAFDQMLDRSAAPLLLSHSGARAIHDHPRNLDDDRIRALAAADGAIGFTTIYLSDMHMSPERMRLFRQHDHLDRLTPAEQDEFAAGWHALDLTEPMWSADLERYIVGLLHVIDVAGIDHVCLGADFDGGGGLPDLADVTALPNITARLRAAGLSRAELEKLWSGNVLRILEAAGTLADDSVR